MTRSTRPADFQAVPRPVTVLAKDWAAGDSTGWHSHPRAQLLYATTGLMVAATARGAWAVPTGHALVIPPELSHEVSMRSVVAMRTAYVAPEALPGGFGACRVIRVSRLLDAALVALAEEPVSYDLAGRGPHLAALVLDEIRRSPAAPFALPLPQDARLAAVCHRMIAEPALALGLDDWAERAGVSRRTLTRGFRAETGLSFGAWRQRLRLLHSWSRQAEGAPWHEVARDVGYRSPQALRAMLRRAAAEASAAPGLAV